MTEDKIITNIKDLKIYIKYLLDFAIKRREEERGTGVYLAENIERYAHHCAEIMLLQRICKKLGLKIDDYDPFEIEEDDNKFNYWGALGAIGVKQND